MSPEPRSGAQSVERALAILRAFETSGSDLGVTEIAGRTGLSVSTAHRLTRALCAGGLLRQDPRTERYQLGPTLVVLGHRAGESLGYARALPLLEDLSTKTGESVNLGIRSGSEVLVVLDVASDQPLRFEQAPGTRVPIHTSAMGKCLLAFSGDPAGAVRELRRLDRLTERTITSHDALLEELRRTQQRGWALNDEERHPGVRAVAAPVAGADGTVIAAVAVQGPVIRLTEERVDEVTAHLLEVTAQMAPLLTAGGGARTSDAG